jgi:hypothetical protein
LATRAEAYAAFLRTNPEWQALRDEVRLREKGICEWCNKECWAFGHCHHTTYIFGWLPPTECLCWLCPECHFARHFGDPVPTLRNLREKVKTVGQVPRPEPTSNPEPSLKELDEKLRRFGVG